MVKVVDIKNVHDHLVYRELMSESKPPPCKSYINFIVYDKVAQTSRHTAKYHEVVVVVVGIFRQLRNGFVNCS